MAPSPPVDVVDLRRREDPYNHLEPGTALPRIQCRRSSSRECRTLVQKSSPDGNEQSITEVTRRSIFDHLRNCGFSWWGRLDEIDFLQRVWDLDALPSTDS